jgi:hypothetical protein
VPLDRNQLAILRGGSALYEKIGAIAGFANLRIYVPLRGAHMRNATLGGIPVDASVSIQRDSTGHKIGLGTFTGSTKIAHLLDIGEAEYEGPVTYFGQAKRMKGKVIIETITPLYEGDGGVSGAIKIAREPDWVK